MTEEIVVKNAKPISFSSIFAMFAFLFAALALAIVALPSFRMLVSGPSVVKMELPSPDKSIAVINGRLDALSERVAAAEGNAASAMSAASSAVAAPQKAAEDIEDRLKALEEASAVNNAAVAAANEKLQQSTEHLPIALALVRVEERFERGQNFKAALDVVQKIHPLSDDDVAILVAADGVPTTDELLKRLSQSERNIRRDARLSGVQNPFERILAELQSLVLIKTAGVAPTDVIGQSIAAMEKALQADDKVAFDAAWQQLPEASRNRMAAWHDDVQHRLAAHAVIERVMADILVR